MRSATRSSHFPEIALRRSLRSRYVLSGATLASLMVLPFSLDWGPLFLQQIDVGGLTLPLPLLLLPVLTGLAALLHDLFDCHYFIADDHVAEVKGKLSLERHSQRLLYIHIRGVEIDQGPLARILNVGDLRITSDARQGGMEVVFGGIHNPRRWRSEIEERLRYALHEYYGGKAVIAPAAENPAFAHNQ